MSTLNPSHLFWGGRMSCRGWAAASDAAEVPVKSTLSEEVSNEHQRRSRMKDGLKKNICTRTPLVSPSVRLGHRAFSFLRRSSPPPSSRYRFILGELTCEKASLTEERESRLSKPDKLQITSHVLLRCLTSEPSFKISQSFILRIKNNKTETFLCNCSRTLI